ncbi:MAG: hypothetical protein ABIP53_00130 [Candidatus Limnocylindrales bacterium]
MFNRRDVAADTSSAFTIAVNGTDERQVGAANVSCTGWSPDLRAVCTDWLPNGARPAVVDSEGAHLSVLDAYPDRERSVICEEWFPDGARLLCRTEPDGSQADDGLYVVDASDGSDVSRITSTPDRCFDGDEVLSPNETELLFVRFCESDGRGTLFRVGIDGTDLVGLSGSDATIVDAWDRFPADWSPDGSHVVFSARSALSTADPAYVLFVANRNGTGIRQVVPDDVGAVTARWSPDASWIAFTSKLRSEPQVWLVHPDGTGLVELTQSVAGSTSLAPIWSPDGSRLLFATAHSAAVELWTIGVDGSVPSRLTDLGSVESIGYAWGASTQ